MQIFLLILSFLNGILAYETIWSLVPFDHELKLGENFGLKWNSEYGDMLTMEMSGRSTGYVSIGWSKSGQMGDGDIIMGWVDSEGNPHIKDLFAVGNKMPLVDHEQNVEVLWGQVKNNWTTIRFRRKWDTGDTKHDMSIKKNMLVNLIWAIGDDSPVVSEGALKFFYHGPDDLARGQKSAYLRDGKNSDIIMTKFEPPSTTPSPFSSTLRSSSGQNVQKPCRRHGVLPCWSRATWLHMKPQNTLGNLFYNSIARFNNRISDFANNFGNRTENYMKKVNQNRNRFRIPQENQ